MPIEKSIPGSFVEIYLLSDGEGFDNDLGIYGKVFRTLEAGNVSYLDVYDRTRTIPVDSGETYPVVFKQIKSNQTTINASSILVYR
jgi:hypothetical protein